MHRFYRTLSWQPDITFATTEAQYTPPTPTRRNCRVESRQQCVHNSQLLSDIFDESEQICQQRVELRRDGGVNAPVVSRRELVANCVHTADTDATQIDNGLRRVGDVYWALDILISLRLCALWLFTASKHILTHLHTCVKQRMF